MPPRLGHRVERQRLRRHAATIREGRSVTRDRAWPRRRRARPAAACRPAIAAYLLWGLLTIYWKELRRFDPFELIGWRIISASLVMAAVITARGRWGVLIAAPARASHSCGRLAVAAVLLTANWTGYVWAVANDRVLETALGYFMAPLATMLLGVTVLGERASPAAAARPRASPPWPSSC